MKHRERNNFGQVSWLLAQQFMNKRVSGKLPVLVKQILIMNLLLSRCHFNRNPFWVCVLLTNVRELYLFHIKNYWHLLAKCVASHKKENIVIKWVKLIRGSFLYKGKLCVSFRNVYHYHYVIFVIWFTLWMLSFYYLMYPWWYFFCSRCFN